MITKIISPIMKSLIVFFLLVSICNSYAQKRLDSKSKTQVRIPVNSNDMSPVCENDLAGGRYAVITYLRGPAKLWELPTGKLIRELPHSGRIRSAFFSNDGKRIVTAGSDGFAKVWDVRTGELLFSLEEEGNVTGLDYACFSPDGNKIVTLDSDCKISIWTLKDRPTSISFKLDRTVLERFANVIGRVGFSPEFQPPAIVPPGFTPPIEDSSTDFPRIITVLNKDSFPTIVNQDEEIVIENPSFSAKHLMPRSAVFTNDGKYLIIDAGVDFRRKYDSTGEGHVTCEVNPSIFFYDLEKKDFSNAFKGKFTTGFDERGTDLRRSYMFPSFSPDSTLLISSKDDSLYVYSIKQGSIERSIKLGHNENRFEETINAKFSPDGKDLLVSMRDSVLLMDWATGRILKSFMEFADDVILTSIDENGNESYYYNKPVRSIDFNQNGDILIIYFDELVLYDRNSLKSIKHCVKNNDGYAFSGYVSRTSSGEMYLIGDDLFTWDEIKMRGIR